MDDKGGLFKNSVDFFYIEDLKFIQVDGNINSKTNTYLGNKICTGCILRKELKRNVKDDSEMPVS